MDCSGPDKGGEAQHACEVRREGCGKFGRGATFDRSVGKHVCNWCWVNTPIPPPKPRRP